MSSKAIFITTKNIDYIRNTQEIRLLKDKFDEVDVIYSDKKNYPGRILGVWSQLKRKRLQSADEIFIGFAPQLILPFWGRKFKGLKVNIDFFISVYDTLIHDRKKFKDHGLVANFCHRLDKKTIDRADHIITDTKAHADYFIQEFDGDRSKFETLYLEADESIYFKRPANKDEANRDKFVVLYFGSVLPLQGVEVILEAASMIKDKDICFEIIGPISDKYNKPQQDNITYFNWLSQQDLSERIANADLCLGGHFNKDIGKALRTIPGKTYIYEMMGKTIVLGENSANHELFSPDESHYFVEMGNPKALRDIIYKIKEDMNDR